MTTFNQAYYEEQREQQAIQMERLIAQFEQAKADFEAVATNPGTGFDVNDWLDLVPTPTISGITIAQVDLPSLLAETPDVVAPTFIAPSAVADLALSQYDSEYLDDIETECRTIITDAILAVLPASSQDGFFRGPSAEMARIARDEVDTITKTAARRKFPVMLMSTAKAVADRVSTWAQESYVVQDKAAGGRLEAAMSEYFKTIQTGLNVEDIRSRVIMNFARVYSNHNSTLAGYYNHLVNEKTSAAQLALDNFEAELRQGLKNIEIRSLDNREELELPRQIFDRATGRIELEFKNDAEVIERRRKVMLDICETYAGWAVGSLEQSQAHMTGKLTIDSP